MERDVPGVGGLGLELLVVEVGVNGVDQALLVILQCLEVDVVEGGNPLFSMFLHYNNESQGN